MAAAKDLLRAHPLQPRGQLAQRGPRRPATTTPSSTPTRSTATTWRSSRTTRSPTTCASSGRELLNDYLQQVPRGRRAVHRGGASRTARQIDAKAASRASGCSTPPSTRSTRRRGGAAGRAEGRAEAPERSRPQDRGPARAAAQESCSTPASATSSTCPRARSGWRSPTRPRSSTTTTTATTRRCSASARSPSPRRTTSSTTVTAPGEIAANLVLDSYNAARRLQEGERVGAAFYANDKLATGKFKDDLAKVIEQSSFKLVSQLEEKKEYAAAARPTWTSSRTSPRPRSPTRRSTTPRPTSTARTCWRRRSPPASCCSATTPTARWSPPASWPTPRGTRPSATSSTPPRPTSCT